MKRDDMKAADDLPAAGKSENALRSEIFKDYFAHQNFDVLMEGVIWSEVLGLPLCKRKNRGIRR